MKKNARRMIHAAVIIAVLVALGFLLRDTTDLFRAPHYDAAAPTSVKFVKMLRWIPAGSEFDITVDVQRALGNPMLKERLMELIHGNTGVAAELVSALVSHENSVGMLALAGTLGNKDEEPRVVVLAQGKFDEGVILPAIRSAMVQGRAGLASQDLGWATLFTESDVRDPFGFIILDKHHLAVGTRDSLLAFYGEKPPSAPESIGRLSDAAVFGHAVIGPRLKGLVPPSVQIPQSVDFSSPDGETLFATLHLSSQDEARSTQMFLEGVRSLIILQQEANLPLVDILKGVTISGLGNDVTISSGLMPLIDLWSAIPASDEEGDEPSLPHVK